MTDFIESYKKRAVNIALVRNLVRNNVIAYDKTRISNNLPCSEAYPTQLHDHNMNHLSPHSILHNRQNSLQI